MNTLQWEVSEETVDKFVSILKHGSKKAIFADTVVKKLGKRLGVCSRDTKLRNLRYVLEAAHDRGIPVAAGKNGYYIATEQSDLTNYASRLQAQRDGLTEKINRVTNLRIA